MAKMRQATSSRTPPVPSDDHADVDAWIRRGMPELSPIVRQVDETIRATIPGLHYAIKWKQAYYGLPDLGWIIQVAAYDVSMNVVFLGGADFDEPPPLGDTDRSRYVKLRTMDDATSPELLRWIEQAARVPGWK